ncbi:MAG: xanthine dehydrogenase family protein molybdopterin-binding subunit [Alphaproteobacteria bacterium]|nr:xanthine dehydrogenase family protein molybdopterin-binding subunit [Alphaproteobacteria bacterium]MBU1548558.1 xanthine dehydrogenase family protein molybdopterin-binding subunit [Alphaproteobacteria bacterium]MBU2337754.1 xanthine dehydrogenase family protein molybdopterin-binding subunit [Alphaproteobacteria bacterium]MBU2389891.1 xanthine dehydrogenase family protein molybdopterin-binding subunit [Alphaproteobacteria bacterium]
MTMAPDTTAYIGQPHRRQNALRHLAGRGRFTTDLVLPRMVHAAFVRSPVARGQILAVDVEQASRAPGVICVLTAADLNPLCMPWVGTLDHFARMASPPQNILAETHVVWAGQPVVMVIASSRAQAEDACELVVVEIEDQEPVVDGAAALAPGADTASPGLASNLCYETVLETADVDAAFAKAACVVDGEFSFGRHTAVTLEPRAVVADFDPSTGQLTVHQGTQTPYQFQDVYARHFGLSEGQVRVIAADVGGSFGMKLHVYHEEMATVAASKMLGRPVRFVADRLESFLSDIHARDHKVRARMAVDANGIITAMEVDDLTQIGAFSAYPRTSAAEGNQVIRLMGGPYRMQDYRGRLSVVFQNKVQTSQYRAVGHPIACAVTEVLVDRVAEALGQDPLDLRGRNVVPDDAYPHTSATGYQFEKLSHQACLARLRQMMDYETLRAEQAMLRKTRVYRGIGIAPFIEITNPGAAFYGVGGARISAQDGAVVKLTPSGDVQCMISVTEQGQGTETIIAQIVGEQLGVSPERVKVITGDTDTTPVGGATWACRGAGIGGETALRAGRKLRDQILTIAAAVLQSEVVDLRLADASVVDAHTGAVRLSLAEIGRIATYRPDTLPSGTDNSLTAAQHYAPSGFPFAFTNGVQASHVEVDVETGLVKLLKHWVVEDCGRIINPLLVDEQIRGGVVQGLGAALFEECLYDEAGQLTNGSLAEYLVPMACEMPDIVIGHVETPTLDTILGAKGVGEAGTAAAGAAAMNAVNDALLPFKARLMQTPMTPARILAALGHV